MTGTMPIVEIENLTKDFSVGFFKKHPVRALDNLNLQVQRGEIFGFLGPNGAGKSTTIKIVMNLLHPSSGSARILGEPVNKTSMHQRIGYLPENPYFYDYLTPAELLTYAGKLFGIRRTELNKRVDQLLDEVGLTHARHLQLRKFSKGMIQRIGIAQAIINEPEVVFFDEPMSGLDPLGRMEVRRIITSLKARGVTVFFSSHILPDVEALCDRIAILNKGKLQEMGALHDILHVSQDGHEAVISGVTPEKLDEIGKICSNVWSMGDRLHAQATKANLERLLAFVFDNGLELISVNPIRPSLEEHFQQSVAKEKYHTAETRSTQR
jgi:ABC-2 type transport system ATP-binding protein